MSQAKPPVLPLQNKDCNVPQKRVADGDTGEKRIKLNDGSSSNKTLMALFKQQAWFQEQQMKQQREFQNMIAGLVKQNN